MKKLNLFLIILIAFQFSCSDKERASDEDNITANENSSIRIWSRKEINQFIYNAVNKSGRFEWNMSSDTMLYSAIVQGDSILTIGFGNSSFAALKSAQNDNIKNSLIELVRNIENKNAKLKSEKDILLCEGEQLNYFDVKISKFSTLQILRKNKSIRYLDPSGYSFLKGESALKSASGCNFTPSAVNAGDYSTVAPGCLVSWTFYKHNIPAAWQYSSGKGVTVGLIDTGISPDQALLGSEFNTGYSQGRSVSKYGTFVDSFWPWVTTTDGVNDKCGHGTSMAASIAGPRNSRGLPVGVAYNCNLVAYRGTGDVVLDGYHEQNGVANALRSLANMSSVKIISMSIGHIFGIGKIEDAIKYAYSKNKLIFAAGGTSTELTNWAGVIFPAWMAECVAVTGITDGQGYSTCAVCHKGSKIDFTVIMERSGDKSRNSVCLGYYNNTKTYVGGSSVSTAITAGMAALVWARYPSYTREQVLDKLKRSASLYPNKNAEYGYGCINALAAVQ